MTRELNTHGDPMKGLNQTPTLCYIEERNPQYSLRLVVAMLRAGVHYVIC